MWSILNSSQRLKKEMILLKSTNTFSNCFSNKKNDCNIKCWLKIKWFFNKILNRFLTRYWNYRVDKKNNRFAKKISKISKNFRMKRMFRILMIRNLISDSTTKFLIRLLLWYLIWCFLDDLDLIDDLFESS